MGIRPETVKVFVKPWQLVAGFSDTHHAEAS